MTTPLRHGLLAVAVLAVCACALVAVTVAAPAVEAETASVEAVPADVRTAEADANAEAADLDPLFGAVEASLWECAGLACIYKCECERQHCLQDCEALYPPGSSELTACGNQCFQIQNACFTACW